MNFGDYLKEMRKKSGLSQRQLAEISGISNTEISRLESGKRVNPSPKILKALAPNLGVSYNDLLKKTGYLDDINYDAGFTVSDDEKLDFNPQTSHETFDKIKDVEFLKLMIKAANELPSEDIKVIKDMTNLLLSKNTSVFKSYISYINV